MPHRVFLLSPARLDGQRAKLILNPNAMFPLAEQLRTIEGAPIGEVFAFLSSLYFRGKIAYARRFAKPPPRQNWIGSGALVITANRGLVPAETRVCIEHLEAFSATDIAPGEKSFTRPLERDARLLAEALGEQGEAVLLGSVASAKYVTVLTRALGEQLLFPSEFVGRGDMSRGGLLLRQVDASSELAYVPVLGAIRHGRRPPKLTPRKRTKPSTL